jgi:autotransporter-associated beta strand protein
MSGSSPPRITSEGRARIFAFVVVVLAGLGFTTSAMAIDVADQAEWNAAIAAVAAAPAGSTVTIDVTSGFTLTSSLAPIVASNPGVTVVVVGNGQTLNGNSQFQGVEVSGADSPTIEVSNLTVTNMKAVGGTGASGADGAGGGGLGAGAGLFVGSGAHVTLLNVALINDSAVGGNTGPGGGNNSGGSGGGGLNGGNGQTGQGAAGSSGGSGGNGGSGPLFLGSGGAGGVGGGGGANSTGAPGSNGATGGGGGGGGGGAFSTGNGANGGNGGFGGGGGGGGYGGATSGAAGQAGFGGGAGGIQLPDFTAEPAQAGTGYGGAVFVMQGATLTIETTANLNYSGNTTSGGTGGLASSPAEGQDIYINGPNQSVTFDVESGTSTFTGSAQTAEGDIAGTGGIVKTGLGTLVLTAVDTYAGGTMVNEGLINFNSASNFGTGLITLDGGGLQWASANTTDISGQLAPFGSGGGTFDYNGNSVSLATPLTGVGGMTVANSGSGGALTLTAAESYSGPTVINSGAVLALKGGASIAPSSGVVDNGAFDISGIGGGATPVSTPITTLSGTSSGSVFLGFNQLIIADAQGAFAGEIADGGISGRAGGSLAIEGGTETLTGANTYTGGTLLAGGTLVIGNNSALGTGVLAMSPGTTLSFLNGGNFTVPNPITITGDPSFTPPSGTAQTISGVISNGSSPGTLDMSGGGALVLSGANTYTGPTNVGSGILDVTGSIASSSLTTVGGGATLTGDGAVGATQINSGGVFVPGSGAPDSSMSVFGALAFNAGATYQVQVNPATASLARVNGSTALAGAVVADFAPGAYVSRRYTILTASGGLGGTTFAGLNEVDPPAGFAEKLTYDADDVYLNLSATLAIVAAGLNVNQRNVANALDGAFNSGTSLPPSFVNVFGLTGDPLANALTELSGEAAAGARQNDFLFTDMFLSLLLDPYVENRGGGIGQAGSFGAGPGCSAEDQAPSSAAALPTKKPSAPTLPCAPYWTVWGAGFGGGEQTSGNAAFGSHDTSIGAGGGAVGADYHISPDSMAGFAIAGGATSWSLSGGLGGGNSNVFQLGLYGADDFGPAYVAGALSFGNYWMTTNRTVTLSGGGAYSANFTAQGFGGRVETGYRVLLTPMTLTPYVALQAQAFEAPSYAESASDGGPGFGLNYASQSATDTRFELGAWANKTLVLSNDNAAKIFGRVAWVHDWQSNPALTATFQSLPTASFAVNGAKPAPDQALIAAGLEWRFAANWTVMAKFEGEFGAGTQAYSGTARISYAW